MTLNEAKFWAVLCTCGSARCYHDYDYGPDTGPSYGGCISTGCEKFEEVAE